MPSPRRSSMPPPVPRCGSGASRGRCRPRPGGATWPPRRTRAPDRSDPSSAARSSTPSCSVRPPRPRHRLPSGCRRRSARPRLAGAAASSGSTSASASRSRGSRPRPPRRSCGAWSTSPRELDDGRQAIRWQIRRGRGGGAPAARLADWELAQLWSLPDASFDRGRVHSRAPARRRATGVARTASGLVLGESRGRPPGAARRRPRPPSRGVRLDGVGQEHAPAQPRARAGGIADRGHGHRSPRRSRRPTSSSGCPRARQPESTSCGSPIATTRAASTSSSARRPTRPSS